MSGRRVHKANLLLDSTALVTEGCDQSGCLDSAELYDPDSGTWSTTGNMNTVHALHTRYLAAGCQAPVHWG